MDEIVAKKGQISLSVVIPMYNEEDNVTNTVKQVSEVLGSLQDRWEIVLVNDGSTDHTLQVAEELAKGDERVRVISYPRNAGRGKALRTGFASARGDIVVSTDADLSYEPKYILNLIEVLNCDEDVDIVIGSPYVKGGGTENVPLARLLISKLGNKVLSFAMSTNGRLNTITGIFRAYRRPVLESLELESDGKELHLEILSKAMALGYRAREVPVILKGRQSGRSKFRFRATAISHIVFSVYEKPMMLFGLIGFTLIVWGLIGGVYIIVLWRQKALNPERPLMTLLVLLVLTGTQLLSFGFLGTQLAMFKKEVYKVQKENREIMKRLDDAVRKRLD
jgi:glycosyltransferase involved in cell wall biosynthesis